MTPVLRIAAVLVCIAGAVAWWVNQTRRASSAVEHRAGPPANTAPAPAPSPTPPSPWEEAVEARARWVTEVKRHKPDCDALGEFLAACEPLVAEVEAHAGATPVEVRSLEQFAPDPSVRAFLQGRAVLLAKRVGGRLRPCCDVCDPLCVAAGFAKDAPLGSVARAPDVAVAGAALLLIVRHASREAGGHDVILIDVAGRREVARYRVFRGASQWRRRRGPGVEPDPLAHVRVGQDLTPFLGRLLFECVEVKPQLPRKLD